jgi:FtsP/CotA-like multicopper oxidase with cupredoxin domain
MRFNTFKSLLIKSGLAASVLLLASGASFAQSVSLTAGATTTTLPDGSVVPMWGYSCSAAAVAPATCVSLNTKAAVGTWSPVVITVPPGNLTINLTNSLPAAVPETSLVIVGQLGGGLGTAATSVASPAHATQDTTWPIAAAGPQNVPPPQGNRVQSFSTPVGLAATLPLTWTGLRAGTYLIESGTHPSIQGPMGLYGILVVTTAPAGTTAGCAYPGAAAGTCAVTYSAEVPMLLSEIDPVQNKAVNTAVNTAGFSETTVWSGQPGGCGNPGSPVGVVNTCYPPAVNYTPLYYLINGVAFNKSLPAATNPSLFPVAPPTGVTGNVLVRLVNAGLRMHVPSIVGSLTTPAVVATGTTAAPVPGFSLVAEDGNPLPGVSRVQSEVFLAAGKTYDVMLNVPATGGTALPVFDRELSLSGNATARDAGMLAYISVNAAGLPAATGFTAAVARPDTYSSVVTGNTLVVSDPAKGVIANDTNVYGVQLVGTVPGLSLSANGTFTYTGAPTSFTYCANGSVTGTSCSSGITTTVTLGAAPIEAATGISCTNSAFSSTTGTTLSIKPPGILANCKDAAGYPLTVNAASVTASGFTVSVDANGGFNASAAACTTGTCAHSFTFKAQNSQNTVSAASATVTVNFVAGSGIKVALVDGATKSVLTGVAFNTVDFRWVIMVQLIV